MMPLRRAGALLLAAFACAPPPRAPVAPASEMAVAVTLEGAGAEAIEQALAEPIEQALAAVERVEQLRTLIVDGRVEVRALFADAGARDGALTSIYAALAQLQERLPPEASLPVVRRLDAGPALLVSVGDAQRTAFELRRFAEQVVSRQLEALPGVRSVRLCAGGEAQIEVMLDAQKLAAFDVDAATLVAALQQRAGERPAGRLVAPSGEQVAVSSGAVQDLAQEVVARVGERVVRVGDVAVVRHDLAEGRCHAFLDGRPTALVEVQLASEAGARAAELALARVSLPEGMRVALFDAGTELLRVAPPGTSTEELAQLARAATRAINEAIPGAAVLVMAEQEPQWSPGRWPPEALAPSLRMLVARQEAPVGQHAARLERIAAALGLMPGPGSRVGGQPRVEIARARAAELGVAGADVALALRLLGDGLVVAHEQQQRERLPLRVRLVGEPLLRAGGGARVPLAALVREEIARAPIILRLDRRRVE